MRRDASARSAGCERRGQNKMERACFAARRASSAITAYLSSRGSTCFRPSAKRAKQARSSAVRASSGESRGRRAVLERLRNTRRKSEHDRLQRRDPKVAFDPRYRPASLSRRRCCAPCPASTTRPCPRRHAAIWLPELRKVSKKTIKDTSNGVAAAHRLDSQVNAQVLSSSTFPVAHHEAPLLPVRVNACPRSAQESPLGLAGERRIHADGTDVVLTA